jgi:geranylgeranyl pyrophosphate synthase
MKESGSIDYVFIQVQDQISRAKQKLEGIQHSSARQSLCMMADYVAGRLK